MGSVALYLRLIKETVKSEQSTSCFIGSPWSIVLIINTGLEAPLCLGQSISLEVNHLGKLGIQTSVLAPVD